MDSSTFLGLEPRGTAGATNGRWSMEVVPGLATSGRFLFGGAALAGVVAAMEQLSRRPLVWATGQYLSYARLGEVLEIDVLLAVTGNQVTQARGIGRVGGREVIAVNAALGAREFDLDAQFAVAPVAPAPGELPEREHRHPIGGTVHERFEQRVVSGRGLAELDGTSNDGRTTMWVRIRDLPGGVDAAALAVLGDFVPMGVGQALGVRGGGNSLDNTLRVVRLVPTEWVLLDILIDAVERGFGHGSVRMYAEDGTLLATASQTCIVRVAKEDE